MAHLLEALHRPVRWNHSKIPLHFWPHALFHARVLGSQLFRQCQYPRVTLQLWSDLAGTKPRRGSLSSCNFVNLRLNRPAYHQPPGEIDITVDTHPRWITAISYKHHQSGLKGSYCGIRPSQDGTGYRSATKQSPEKISIPIRARLSELTLGRDEIDGDELVNRQSVLTHDSADPMTGWFLDDQAERARGLELLLGATIQRPLYTDGLSLASDLLRRWPDTRSNEARAQRLSFLSDFSCVTRWDEVMVTTRTGW